ncbi:hypothetical protein K7G98_38645, partial [Saccharothrix sp. MB29]|nr:hypothetical protein [Saccharothrix sp. MB29]
MAGLAKAVADLPDSWTGDSLAVMATWLKLPDSEWRDDALWQIEQCRPPRHAVAERTAGTAWLKWFLHRILPYPTFLLNEAQVALA